MSEAFIKKLNDSEWMGTVAEVGLGVPFTNELLRYSGASKTLLNQRCPYGRLYQDWDDDAVSRDAVLSMSNDDYNSYQKISHYNESRIDNIFHLAVSGAYKKIDERGQTHGWIAVRTSKKISFCHFWIAKGTSREEAFSISSDIVQWFLDKILFDECDWKTHITNRPQKCCDIDVIDDKSISFEDHMLLLNRNNPLFIDIEGKFDRAVDAMRTYDCIYRGSFNPITLAHLSIAHNGASCEELTLFEISVTNARKGTIDFADLKHRVNMLNLCHKPILITSLKPTFAELHELIRQYNPKPIYIVGSDTFNAICDEKYIPKTDFLDKLAQESKFRVSNREGFPITDNSYASKFNIQRFRHSYEQISSTKVRNNPSVDFLPATVYDYIVKHNLYKSEHQ